MANVSTVNALRFVQVLFVLASLILLFIALDEVDNAKPDGSSKSSVLWECRTETELEDRVPTETKESCSSDSVAHYLNALIDGLAALALAGIAVALRPSSRKPSV
jgi:hypothetical protein